MPDPGKKLSGRWLPRDMLWKLFWPLAPMTRWASAIARCFCLAGQAAGRGRSEIIAATFGNVRRDGDGFVYDLRRSKANQSGISRPRIRDNSPRFE